MYERVYSTRFKKDLRLAEKRGKNLTLIEEAIDRLAKGETLPRPSPEGQIHRLP